MLAFPVRTCSLVLGQMFQRILLLAIEIADMWNIGDYMHKCNTVRVFGDHLVFT